MQFLEDPAIPLSAQLIMNKLLKVRLEQQCKAPFVSRNALTQMQSASAHLLADTVRSDALMT